MEGLAFTSRRLYLKNTLCVHCLRRIQGPDNRPISRAQNVYPQPPPKPTFQFQIRAHKTLSQGSQVSQAYPLKGYYSDILSHPTRVANPARHDPSTPPAPAAQASSDTREPTPAEKMSIVFGTRLAGPGYTSRYNPTTPPDSTWQTINGVPIPPRPSEPDNCCMSGCVHCVWDDYRDDIEEWAARVREAKNRAKVMIEAGGDVRHKPRREVESASMSMDDDGGGSEGNWVGDPLSTEAEDLFEGIPVGFREFMKTEKRLKQKKTSQQEVC
ncbi:uncharacterized protein CIMG_08617 [Coccidioides immitis RS]|uniref:Oxidoreductase-like domain-containing protein n=4 Tax=Coccidioides TaxID=5500 RepID=J3K5V7_COCIM|nr:uncharacterized protein CIMG_08617 [Coccidioides immitis RS]XP_003070499.1 hypothetical protein CPC735_062270 [Coccidioides posadasii C735 delta SOWgp]EFW18005.1 conserved hypothetical protein [Coccidioides posadasii str. Silveira]KMU91352.1 hypothetical protein CIHG_09097 [Coccidioides immitis H538.4]TPX22272.1 hypothetical protein DIZ76_014140 [Coccidioides immitis]EAS29871.3 hypothetical protein CIMG_08617 [Coccidioides immitis RS]EER28354.1 hypothetical protein CPC735_062270 [Coccidioi|eukprot:XP_003070499.1 hypothetical protein CPC735_062270 [Coccidioides posadasii C735 delta SOWgp]